MYKKVHNSITRIPLDFTGCGTTYEIGTVDFALAPEIND
jgi:hypothetical protein